MDSKLDVILGKIGDLFDKWVTEFENNPLRTTIKVVLILAMVKWAKRSLR